MLLNLSVELTDLCNARCRYCSISTGQPPHHGQQMGFLEVADFRNIFERFDELLHDPVCTPSEDLDVCVRLCGIGEPTLHPKFLEFFQIALRQPHVKQLTMVTNGSYLPPERTEAMVSALRAFPEVTVDFLFGLDAIDPETQRRIKQTSNIHKIHADIEHLLDLKIRHVLPNLKCIFQLIVTDENASQVKPFCRYWERVLRSKGLTYDLTPDWSYLERIDAFDAFIWIKRRDADGPDQPHFDALHRAALAELGLERPVTPVHGVPKHLLEQHEQEQREAPGRLMVCGLFWYGINVNAAGEVSPCCIDNDFELKIGNIREAALRDIYRGETMRRFRRAHLARDFSELPLCARCDSIHKYKFVSHGTIEKYLKGIGEVPTQVQWTSAGHRDSASSPRLQGDPCPRTSERDVGTPQE